MKGHTVPWAFIPKEIQAILAIALIVYIVSKIHNDIERAGRWWPLVSAVSWVLLTPLLMGWLGFGPQGIGAKTMAAELQSLATQVPWLTTVVSALQSVSTKGMGLKTAGVIFMAGGGFGRFVVVRGHRQLLNMGVIPEQRQPQEPNHPAPQLVMQGVHAAQDSQPQPNPQHPHRD